MIFASVFTLQGSVALHRRGDGIVLNSESSPFILGVSSQFSSEHLYVRALETSEIARVSLETFNRVVRNTIYGSIFQSC
jgi:CRP-like cAMP-binding protein